MAFRKSEFADKMNNMPKYVVSTTLKEGGWNNTTVIKSNIAEEVSRLKAMPGKEILVAGSGQLVCTLIQHDLVDELRLMVFPVILGRGRRLFEDGNGKYTMKLAESKPVGSGVLILIYHPEKKQ